MGGDSKFAAISDELRMRALLAALASKGIVTPAELEDHRRAEWPRLREDLNRLGIEAAIDPPETTGRV